MATVLNIVIEDKNGRIETLMTGGGKGKVTQGEVEHVMAIAELIKNVLAASGGEIAYFKADVVKAMKAAGVETH
ncbi:hypothetical protein MOR33_003148 [Salmonella enterica]|nr:hypothetical protein [Salmonella enterica]EGL7479213.1 hypothetical protein [Salmonella enterica]EIZ2334197.1 hypothetical protein [Salmonella enterica]